MTNKITILFLSLTLSFIPNLSYSEEGYCIDIDGFILPIFNNDKCINEDDIKINNSEFEYIIETNVSKRLSKLDEFRNSPNKTLNVKKEGTNEVSNDEKNKKIEIAEKQKNKNIERQKKIDSQKAERLAKIEKRKKELEEKRIKRQAEQERKKAERLAKIEKEKKLVKIKKEIISKKENSKKIEIKQSDNLNNKLKVIFADKKIVRNELLPNINPSQNIDYEINKDLNLDYVKNLFSNNSNLIIIIPKDFDTFSNIISEENLTSQMVAGTRSVPNPEFNKLQAEMRRAERELQRAQAEAERGFQMSQCISCGLITQWGGIALQEKWQNEGAKLQSRLNNLISNYSNTPDYLEKEMLRNYTFTVHKINAEKNAIYQIIKFKDKKILEKNIIFKSNKNFEVAYNIDPQDKKYENLLNKYSTSDQVSNWQNQKIKDISLEEFKNLIDNESNFKEFIDEKELYASLNFTIEEELSWWEKLFSVSKKDNDKKTASLSNKSSSGYEVKDVRFDSVVIVETENGLGSGFFISSDEILTNYHVIENSTSISITDKFKKRSSAVVIKKDLRRDLAILKTNTSGKPVKFFSGKLKQGEMVEALGHPKGRKFSLTKGWISAIRKESSVYSATGTPDVLFIQTDAAINPGNSGGPLFYKDEVVGVNTQGLHKDSTEGMNFAVHFSEVNKFLSK